MAKDAWPAHLPALPANVPPGWTILPDDDIATLIHEDSALPYLDKYFRTERVRAALLEYIAVHAETILASPTFLRTPVTVLQAVISYPFLQVCEDDLLSHIIRYALHQTGVQTHFPDLWSAEERAKLLPVLSDLVPYLAVLSVSTAGMLLTLEPLDILSIEYLIMRYKFGALIVNGKETGKSAHEIMVEFWGGPSCLCIPKTYEPWLRPSIQIAESSHPIDAGVHDKLQVSLDEWNTQMCIEFDKRCSISPETSLEFFADGEYRQKIGDWSDLWSERAKKSHGRKFWVVPASSIWMSIKCPSDAPRTWGWRLIARPTLDLYTPI